MYVEIYSTGWRKERKGDLGQSPKNICLMTMPLILAINVEKALFSATRVSEKTQKCSDFDV